MNPVARVAPHSPVLTALCLALALGPVAGAPAAAAERRLTAAEFEARVTGKTFYYNAGGQAYGAEQYKADRRVVWAFTGDDCKDGIWYEESGFICFRYDDNPDAPQCWTFFDRDGRLLARFRDDPAGAPLIAVQQSPKPMACMGPDLGV